MSSKVGVQIERLAEVMRRLRGEGGCPWDREQDLRSLRPYLLEEAFEVLDEMDRVAYGGPWQPLCEELGDLLFQIVFHAQLASEQQAFTLAEVAQSIADKLERRHPHVFGDAKVSTSEQVLDNWAKLKADEKKRKTGSEGSVLDGVPTAAPALMRAERLTEKASRVGFDWPDVKSVRAKLDEELGELDEAITKNDRDALEHEVGDVLLALVNLARFLRTPPEDALRQAINRFVSRFHQVEAGLRAEQVPFGQATLEQMEAHWQKAKAKEAGLPKPRALPEVAVSRLTVTTPALEETEKFFSPLLPWLGWRRPRGAALVFHAAGLALEFVHGPSSPLVVTLAAPSSSAVRALASALGEHGARRETTTDAVQFADPSGCRWRYAFSPQPL